MSVVHKLSLVSAASMGAAPKVDTAQEGALRQGQRLRRARQAVRHRRANEPHDDRRVRHPRCPVRVASGPVHTRSGWPDRNPRSPRSGRLLVRRYPHWRHRHVSAVLIARNLQPWTVSGDVPTLWEHPDPEYPLVTPPMWARMFPGESSLERREPAVVPSELFGLPTEWPEGDPFDPFPPTGDAALPSAVGL